MAKATSASKARNETKLKQYVHEGVMTAGLLEAERERDAIADWRGSWWSKQLSSFENPAIMALRILSEDGIISDDALLESLLETIPQSFSRYGTSISEVIEKAQQWYGDGVVVNEESMRNGIMRRFAKKLLKLVPTLYIGLNTDTPEEVMYYDGPAPSWEPPAGHRGDWVLTPDYAVFIFKRRDLYVPFGQFSNERERIHKLIAAHHQYYKKLMDWAARDEIFVLKRRFTELGEGEQTGTGVDVGEMIRDLENDDKFTDAGYVTYLKTPQQGLHESHHNSSPTIEASAAALAHIMMEEIVGKNYYSAPVQHKDGVWRRQLAFEDVGLIGQLEGTSEDLRRHIRLIAFLHSQGSLFYLAEERVGRDRNIYRTYKRMSPEMIANEWSEDSEVNNPRVIRSFPAANGDMVDNTVKVTPAHDEVVTVHGSRVTQKSKRYYLEECEVCMSAPPEYQGDRSHWQNDAGHEHVVHYPRRVYDGDTRRFFGDNDQYMVKVKEITTRTELLSHEDGLTKRKMAKAMDAFYSLLQLARHQLMEDEGFVYGPRMESGLFYSKLHPAESGRGKGYVRVDPEGIKHAITDAMGWWFDFKWEDHTHYDKSTRVLAFSDRQFGTGESSVMKYGEYTHFWTDDQGGRRALNFRGVYLHPEHEGCIQDGTLKYSRVEPTYVVSELDDKPETPLIDSRVKDTKSDKDIFNETLTSLMVDIALGEESE